MNQYFIAMYFQYSLFITLALTGLALNGSFAQEKQKEVKKKQSGKLNKQIRWNMPKKSDLESNVHIINGISNQKKSTLPWEESPGLTKTTEGHEMIEKQRQQMQHINPLYQPYVPR